MEERFDSFVTGMKKSKSSNRDRLSELPDSLILHILSFLVMEDVLRTTVLSKRWKDLWNTIPCLTFVKEVNDGFAFQNNVNRTLLMWKGSKIRKFAVHFCYKESACSDVDLWLRLTIENQVEELNLNLINDWDGGPDFIDYMDNYSASQCLYTCSSIRELSLSGCDMKIHRNVHWDNLKCLIIENVCLSKHVIDKILLGSPQLEVLVLSLIENYESVNIHSSSLKRLIVEKYKGDTVDDESETVNTIWAPKLEVLNLSAVLYDKWVLSNVSSITKATVAFKSPLKDVVSDVLFSGFELLEDILGQISRSKRYVRQVKIPYVCIDKVIRKMMKKYLVAPLSGVKFLELYVTKEDEILNVLEVFPKLTVLRLVGKNSSSFYCDGDKFEIRCGISEPFVAENSDIDFPNSCLLYLMKVEIDWTHCEIDSIFPIIEFLLKYGSKLEKLVLWIGIRMSRTEILSTATKLLALPRSSPNVEIVLR